MDISTPSLWMLVVILEPARARRGPQRAGSPVWSVTVGPLRSFEEQVSDLSEWRHQVDGDAEVERHGDGWHDEADDDCPDVDEQDGQIGASRLL